MRRIDLADVVAGVGLLLLTLGFYLTYPPAALIAIGVVLLALGIVGSR